MHQNARFSAARKCKTDSKSARKCGCARVLAIPNGPRAATLFDQMAHRQQRQNPVILAPNGPDSPRVTGCVTVANSHNESQNNCVQTCKRLNPCQTNGNEPRKWPHASGTCGHKRRRYSRWSNQMDKNSQPGWWPLLATKLHAGGGPDNKGCRHTRTDARKCVSSCPLYRLHTHSWCMSTRAGEFIRNGARNRVGNIQANKCTRGRKQCTWSHEHNR